MGNFRALTSSVSTLVKTSMLMDLNYFSSFSNTNLIAWKKMKSFLQNFEFTLHGFRFLLPTFNAIICTKRIGNLWNMKGRMLVKRNRWKFRIYFSREINIQFYSCFFSFYKKLFSTCKSSKITKARNLKYGDMVSLYIKLRTCIFGGARWRGLRETG